MTGPELATHRKRLCPNLKILYMSGYARHLVIGGIVEPHSTVISNPSSSLDLLMVRTALQEKNEMSRG